MKKKKTKERKIYHRLAFWLGVLVLGTIVGISIQFSRAWVEPSFNAPDGNIAAPINTGASKQVKQGDICTTVTGTEICLSSLANPTFLKCNFEGGSEVDIGGGVTVCKIPGTSCPTGWHQYNKFSETNANTCVGTNGGCAGATTVTTGSHPFSDIDPATEARTYYSTGSYSYIAYYEWVWVATCCCWWPCDSSYQTPVYATGCNSTPNTCLPFTRAVGCVAD
ncbi:MAG: hypothetical protein WC643_03550 [Parcubacteria group bacterium]|jgi:hypothetical protein